MFSRPLAFVLLALACVTAAAGGAYVATRHNATDPGTMAPTRATAGAQPVATGAEAQPASRPVAETEAAVTAAKTEPAPSNKPSKAEAEPAAAPRRADVTAQKPAAPKTPGKAASQPAIGRTVPFGNGATPVAPLPSEPPTSPVQAPPPAPEPLKAADPQPEPPRVPQFEEVILPSSSVIGLQLETSLSSERSRLEDRVDARVSRDVMAAGRVAIPAGARVIGSVIEIDKGGKVKTPAHIGIRFHTLVLADGEEVALSTKPIYRDGESPSGGSAKKIGGGAVAGMILGGILGGGKGAAIGGATGAAGGTAAVMSGDRVAVNIPSGSFMTATLSSPATITVERRE
jgi:hypothetical protein